MGCDLYLNTLFYLCAVINTVLRTKNDQLVDYFANSCCEVFGNVFHFFGYLQLEM